MSWLPQNLAQSCVSTNLTNPAALTTCQSSTFMFVQLVTTLFGRAPEDALQQNQQSKLPLQGQVQFPFQSDYFAYQEGVPASVSQEQLPIQQEFEFSSLDDLKVNIPTNPPTSDAGKYSSMPGSSAYESVGGQNFINNDPQELFDFIVIGAGTAGCVVANRLSEIPKWSVLLLEAGEEEPDVALVPGFTSILRQSSIDWGYQTMPHPLSCTARIGGRCLWPRGRVMGGTSSINLMIYLRGSPQDYDDWAAMGNPGWSYKDVLPYFIRTERNKNVDKVGTHYHGTKGDWNVEYFPYQDQNVYYLLEGLKELGLELFDQNGERQVGASLMQHSTQDGQRVSANDAFIRPIRGRRKNLVVRSRSYVTRILIDPKTKTAYGVEYNENGQLRRSYARKEVIVSGGVINSPQLLMLSGIGPAEELKEFRIPLIKDLRVGYNLHDHTTCDGIVIALSNITATTASQEQIQHDIDYYRKTHRGPLSGSATLQVNAFFQTKYERDYDRPDIQLSLDPSNINNYVTDPILTALTNVLPTSYYDSIAVRPVLLAPKSRGVIRLNRTHPVYGPPLIYANTFSERIDFDRLLEGINQAVSLGQTKTFESIGAGTVPYPMPACRHLPWGTREYWSCVLIAYTTTLYHPVGTCKMGPKTDPHAVVNPELKVYGVRRLRVIDGSIMPLVPRANTNTATLMIAEKGSDMIKADWLLKSKQIYPRHSANNWKGFISNVKSAILKALAV